MISTPTILCTHSCWGTAWRCSATCFAVSEPQALKASVLLPCTPSARDFLCLQTNYRLSRIKGNCRQDCWKALQDPSNSKQLSVIRRSSVEGRMNEQRKIHKGPTRTRTMAEHSKDTTKSQTDNSLISIDSGSKTPHQSHQ